MKSKKRMDNSWIVVFDQPSGSNPKLVPHSIGFPLVCPVVLRKPSKKQILQSVVYYNSLQTAVM